MKATKRILSVLLTLALGLALLAPAALAAEEELNPKAPVIITQPQSVSVPAGTIATLSVEAKLPDGVEGELTYEWFEEGNETPIGTGATLEIKISNDQLPEMKQGAVIESLKLTKEYYVVVTVKGTGDFTQSNTVSVTVFSGYFNMVMSLLKYWYGKGEGVGGVILYSILLPFLAPYIIAGVWSTDISYVTYVFGMLF